MRQSERAAIVTCERSSGLLFCRVQLEEYVYPATNAPLVEAYGGAFESVYVVLHPFVRVPEAHAWCATRRYPEDDVILREGSKCPWAEVARETGLRTCARMSHALLTSTGAIGEELGDYEGRDALQKYLESTPVWMPVEGRFEPLLRMDFVAAFEQAGNEELVFVPEFPLTDPVEGLRLSGLRNGRVEFPSRGTLVAPDERFLFTVDWDSFFTLFYGPKNFVEAIVRDRHLEGFFAAPTTEHFWFNYVMGCATVTVSPDSGPSN